MTRKTTLELGAALLKRATQRTVAATARAADGPVGTVAKVFVAGTGVVAGSVLGAAANVRESNEVNTPIPLTSMPNADEGDHPDHHLWWGDDGKG